LTRKDSAARRASATKAGTEEATITSTLQGESRHRSAESPSTVAACWATVKLWVTSDMGRADASRRAFCILS
jgi:hypothetical protein